MDVWPIAGLLWLFLASYTRLLVALKFSTVTEKVDLQNVSGQMAAFGDFNSDKATDILVLNTTGSLHTLLLWDTEGTKFRRIPLELENPASVTSVGVGDFDGDGLVDLLTLAPTSSGCSVARVHWISLNQGGIPQVSDSQDVFNASTDLLLILDINGDHRADILSTSCNGSGSPVFVVSQGSRDFTEINLGERPLEGHYTHAYYLDLGFNCLPDLALLRSKSSEKWLDVWTRENDGTLVFNSSLPMPFNATSPLTFVDLDVDGRSEAVMLSCDKVDSHNQLCVNVSIHIFSQSEASTGSNVASCHRSKYFNLELSTNVKSIKLSLPRGLAVSQDTIKRFPLLGDLDLDSDLDLVLPVTNITSNVSAPCVLTSIRSHSTDSQLRPLWDLSTPPGHNTQLALFDLWEDGILDLLMTHDGQNGTSWFAIKQSLSADHTFLKVLVLSGHCYTDCTSKRIPYGSVLTAASVAYSTTDRNGHTQQTRATTRSSSDPLQLPFVLFGLGETPNFIQKLTIGAAIPSPGSSKGVIHRAGGGVEVGSHTWRNLVPNSQVIVIPNPPEKPARWRVELYLTPSHLMFTTAGVLCALAIGMAILIALLHAREKYQDHEERKQAKHKFHFNAM